MENTLKCIRYFYMIGQNKNMTSYLVKYDVIFA